MIYENMLMLVGAYEGFLELERYIDLITGENVAHTYEGGVFFKMNNLFEVIFNMSVFNREDLGKNKDLFYDVIMSQDMDTETKTRIILGLE